MTAKKMGRPSEYSDEIAALICTRIGCGESLKAMCAEPAMPVQSTVYKWLTIHGDFAEMYTRARETQADTLFDEIQMIADTPAVGEKTKKDKDGNVVEIMVGDMIEHRRLQIDARKWMAAKLRPKKYGDKLDLKVSGKLDTISEDQLETRIAELLGKAGTAGAPGGEGSSEA